MELFTRVTRVVPGEAPVVVQVSAEALLEQRRDLASRVRFLVDGGVSIAQIGADMGLSDDRVHMLLRYADALETMAPQPEPEPRELDGDRPAWSYPDETTLSICRMIRAEMQKACRGNRGS